jgi:hypothetical protein
MSPRGALGRREMRKSYVPREYGAKRVKARMREAHRRAWRGVERATSKRTESGARRMEGRRAKRRPPSRMEGCCVKRGSGVRYVEMCRRLRKHRARAKRRACEQSGRKKNSSVHGLSVRNPHTD